MIKEPFFNKLPSKEEFYFDGSLDEKYAIKVYLGKDFDFVKNKFCDHTPLAILQDLYNIGINAFRYYVFGACRYLQTVDLSDTYVVDDASEVYCALVDILKIKFQTNPQEMQYIASYMKKFAKFAIENYESFDINEEIYGNVKEKWQELIKKIENLYEVL